LFSGNQHFTDISVRKRWLRTNVEQIGLPTKLAGDWLEHDLAYAYDYYLDLKAALLKKKLKYYDSISYLVMDDDGNVKRIHVRVGDIVDIEEETEGIAYAQVKAIVTHMHNSGKTYPFFIFNWFADTDRTHNILGVPIYIFQNTSDQRWRRVYPIMQVNRASRAHFVHYCTRNCTVTKHDEAASRFFKNEFFYNAV